MLEIPADYTVVDLETTGFSSIYNHIIEIGCIKYRNGSEVSRYETLVKPPHPIPYLIECITGIKNEMVADAPKFEEVAEKVWEYLADEIIVGHNVNFDINFLYDNFKNTLGKDFTNDFIDTLRLSRKALPNIKSEGYSGYNLDNVCRYFKIWNVGDRHRAGYDCQLTNSLLGCLKDYIAENKINFVESKKYQGQYRNFSERLRNLQAETISDDSHIFYKKCCVFTGKLEEFSRIEAAQIVVNIGGYCEDRVTQKTNVLIVGDMDYKAGLEGYETSKLKRAKQLIERGQDLQIIPESAFYDLIEGYLADE